MSEKQKKLKETIIHLQEEAKSRTLTFLLIGRTGTGKSSTINTLLGKKIAPVGSTEAVTRSVEVYQHEIHGMNIKIVDTPGLCDDLPENGRDEVYMQMIKSEVSEVDCLCLVKKLDDPRITGDDLRTIQLISQVLGSQIWHHAVIVFTCADTIPPEKFNERLAVRTDLVRNAIKKVSPEGTRYRTIAATAISNHEATLDTDKGERWLTELYITIFNSLSRTSVIPFYFATAPRLVTQKKKKKRKKNTHAKNDEAREIVLRTEDEAVIKKKFKRHPILRTIIKAGAVGVGTAIAGIPGGILSGVIAAAIESIMTLFTE
ncbi:GTP-binding protein [Candidatus Poribacteria bacterium]|nr:GTP-binding protein [Candidatus Poribacteria bacterium]